ncbi:unnamed protein product [Rotaria sp. Silwood2]|nr:unnamed protein product [Rotaria sp. Silwood2]CAF4511814.1 unnamed protein product [Rotaria sp. Silwood2]
MISNIYHQHIEGVLSLKEKQEKKKKELLLSIDQLINVLVNQVNDEICQCYENEKRIDKSFKQLNSQSNLLLKQSQSWIHLIRQFNITLKELGNVENYSKIIERECSTITNILATVHQDIIVEQKQCQK